MANRIEEIKRAKDGLDVLDDIYRYAREGFDAIPPDDYERMKWYGLFHRSQTPGSVIENGGPMPESFV